MTGFVPPKDHYVVYAQLYEENFPAEVTRILIRGESIILAYAVYYSDGFSKEKGTLIFTTERLILQLSKGGFDWIPSHLVTEITSYQYRKIRDWSFMPRSDTDDGSSAARIDNLFFVFSHEIDTYVFQQTVDYILLVGPHLTVTS